jgi:hypothetical protein
MAGPGGNTPNNNNSMIVKKGGAASVYGLNGPAQSMIIGSNNIASSLGVQNQSQPGTTKAASSK